jgi:hypothetical protein
VQEKRAQLRSIGLMELACTFRLTANRYENEFNNVQDVFELQVCLLSSFLCSDGSETLTSHHAAQPEQCLRLRSRPFAFSDNCRPPCRQTCE